MAGEETTNQGNVKIEYNTGTTGINMDNTVNQIGKGNLTFALNASVENFDSNSVNYQNEPGNEFCLEFPTGYLLIGEHFIVEENKHIFFLVSPSTGDSEIGYMIDNDCKYHTYINAKCLNFSIDHPIHKAIHKKTNCATEIYWTDGYNERRYLNLDDVTSVYTNNTNLGLCNGALLPTIDCNKLKIQPNFNVPQLTVTNVTNGGSLISGTYQFAFQYSDSAGDGYTSYYSVTNPTPIADPRITTPNFNYEVGKSIWVNITNIDTTGYFRYFNLAVIKTINNITSVELVGTYFIDNTTREIVYTGQNVTQARLVIGDIFEKFPYYEIAQDLTSVQDVLVWDNLTTIDKINFQKIANQITLEWQTYKIPANENYADELNATNLRGYLRDEVYAFEIVFILKNGKQTEGFHIPGRAKGPREFGSPDILTTNPDFIGTPEIYNTVTGIGSSPYWKIYNTASLIGNASGDPIGTATPYQHGEFAYWESKELYPCNEDIWGDLANTPIRHHKFPDVLVSPIFSTDPVTGTPTVQNRSVFPIGVRIDIAQVTSLIQTSTDLTQEEKDNIQSFKIVRGDRGTNKSIIAKGILRNVASYEKEQQIYYYPNYPYNDLTTDPFLNATNNAWALETEPWLIIPTAIEPSLGYYEYKYTDPNTNKELTAKTTTLGTLNRDGVNFTGAIRVCSVTRPITVSGKGLIGPANYDIRYISGCGNCKGEWFEWDDPFTDDNTTSKFNRQWMDGWSQVNGGCSSREIRVYPGVTANNTCNNPRISFCKCGGSDTFRKSYKDSCKDATPLSSFTAPSSQYRQVFNSPETSFGQPFLGEILRLENVMYGAGLAHFVQVKDNALYKLLSKEAQIDALNSSWSISGGDVTATFTAYQAYLTIYINGITRRNYAYSFNSIASYDYTAPIDNNIQVKQRNLDIAQYLIPGVQNVGDDHNINNFQRESSVYLKTTDKYIPLPFPSDTPSLNPGGVNVISERSRLTIGGSNSCATPGKEQDIEVVSYYGSIKNEFVNQWGQIYSYDTIDTGFQKNIYDPTSVASPIYTVFGGDTFISRFAFKTKLPFFIDNRVGAPDDSDIFYDEIGNVAYPTYWHSSRSILENWNGFTNVVSYKAHFFDCPNDPSKIAASGGASGSNRTFYDGYFYLFAYGIPYIYCESSYNTDLRQAFNNKEGDFWPHVSTGIPDEWVQESFVSIANDNTYYYNVTFSKQNKENFFAHLPVDWTKRICNTYFPYRAIYSDPQQNYADPNVNSWLIYRPISAFDFPQNFGSLISLDGIQNRAILARFENKSLLYNTLLTVQTSNPQAAYLGNDTLFKSAPPIDFAETDLGYVGSQNRMLLKIPQGQITIDAKRGQVFLISGNQATDLSAFGSGLNRFFTDHLAFEILRYFPEVDTDNHFNGLGLHGVYDSKYDRVIISKLDYIPLITGIKYDATTEDFYIEKKVGAITVNVIVNLTDPEYFCNKSWTLSFNFNTKTWISFHSYIPNWYIAENNFFYSGLNGGCDLEAIAAKLIPQTTTTTTTFCFTCKPSPINTTTTTTTLFVDTCELDGTALAYSCDINGTVIYIGPSSTTTTTTICVRPSNLNLYGFIYGYQVGTNPIVDFTSSYSTACSAIRYMNSINIPLYSYAVYAQSLSLGETVYLGDGPGCTLVPDGWYYAGIGDPPIVYEVLNGVINSIDTCVCTTTTPTTTLLPIIPECCGVLINSVNGIYFVVNDDNNVITELTVPGYDGSVSSGIALTTNKLWSIEPNTQLVEWNITLNPFTATFSKNIAFPVGFTTSSGIVALNGGSCNISSFDSILVGVDDTPSPQEVVEIDVTGTTAVVTIQFTLQTDRVAFGNPLYTTTGKLLIINQDSITSDFYLSQYDYATGTLEIDANLGATTYTALMECDCNIYISDSTGLFYIVDIYNPSVLVPALFTNQPVISASQIASCVTTELFTSTTTTTTTMVIGPTYCYTVIVTGTFTITWMDYLGVAQEQEVTNDTLYICAQLGSISNGPVFSSNVGDGYIIIGGITPCSTDGDCTTTTTTTTP